MERDTVWDKVSHVIEEDRNDLVDLCLLLGGMDSPAGKERPVCEAVVDWLKAAGVPSWLQPITETSANAIGHLKGVGGGKSLIFDAHLDTGGVPEALGTGPMAKRMETGFVEGELIYGHGIVNDKAQVAAFMVAARALKRCEIRLKGGLFIAGVAFETGASSVDEFQGIAHPGEGFGSRWLVDRGIVTDYALVGETSNFGIVASECGYSQFKISIPGRPVYTPRLVRGRRWQENPNAFERGANVAIALSEWAAKYEERERTEFDNGVINPKAQILAIRGSGPSGMGRAECNIYLDVWLRPGINPRSVQGELQELLNSLGVECEIALYQWSRGYVAQKAEPLINAVKDAHRYIFGSDPPKPPPATLSMWRDINAFNEVGIPSICYGPPRQKETYTYEQNRAMKISDLIAATKVYAFTALKVCGVV